jgi:hypothetical protein
MKPNSTSRFAAAPSVPSICAALMSLRRISGALDRLSKRARWTVDQGEGNWGNVYVSMALWVFLLSRLVGYVHLAQQEGILR